MSTNKSGVLLARVDILRFKRRWDDAIALCGKFTFLESVTNVLMLEKHLESGMSDIFVPNIDKTELNVVYKMINASIWASLSEKYETEMRLFSLRCLFALKRYQEFMQLFSLLNVQRKDLTTNRGLVILAETIFLYAKSLENLGMKSDKTGIPVIKFYEMASEIAESVLTQLHLLFPDSDNLSFEFGPNLVEVIECYLLRQIQILTSGQLIRAFREALATDRIEKIPSLHQFVVEKYIEYLLGNVTSINFETISDSISLSNSKMKLSSSFYGMMSFNLEEEIFYLITIYEKILRNFVLVESRVDISPTTIKILNYYTLLFGRLEFFERLNSTLWDLLKLCVGDFFSLRQFAFTLAELGKFKECLSFLKTCHFINPNDVDVLIQIIFSYFDSRTGVPLDSNLIQYATKLLNLTKPNSFLNTRALLYLGLVHSLLSKTIENIPEASSHKSLALDSFQQAHMADQNDFLSAFHLALHHANERKIEEALKYCLLAYQLQWHNKAVLTLLILLLTANRNYVEAYKVVGLAIYRFPRSLNFLFIKSYIQSEENDHSAGLETCSQMLNMFKNSENDWNFYEAEFTFSDSSVSNVTLVNSADFNSVSRIDDTELDHSRKSLLEFKIWIRTGQIFMELNKLEDVSSCIREAWDLYPNMLSLHLLKARLLRSNGLLEASLQSFLNIVSADPRNCEILYELGLTYLEMEKFAEAENFIREAVKVDSFDHKSWGLLGKVLESNGDYEKAASCYLHAHDLKKTAPVLPFSFIPLIYK